MKQKILTIGCIVLLTMMLITLAGCGNSKDKSKGDKSSNDLIDALNEFGNEQIASWEESGYNGFTVYYIQEYLNTNTKYTIIASGNKEFKTAPDMTKYVTTGIKDYDGTLQDMYVMMSKNNVNYILVYDSNSQNYYNVNIDYKQTTLKKGATYDYPVFSNATKVK